MVVIVVLLQVVGLLFQFLATLQVRSCHGQQTICVSNWMAPAAVVWHGRFPHPLPSDEWL